MLWQKFSKQFNAEFLLVVYFKITLSTEILRRPSFKLWCELPVGGPCPCSISYDCSTKSCFSLEAYQRLKLSKNYFYFLNLSISGKKLSGFFQDWFFALQSNSREHIYIFNFFFPKRCRRASTKETNCAINFCELQTSKEQCFA